MIGFYIEWDLLNQEKNILDILDLINQSNIGYNSLKVYSLLLSEILPTKSKRQESKAIINSSYLNEHRPKSATEAHYL